MKTLWLIALMAMVAGCKTTCCTEHDASRPPERMAHAEREDDEHLHAAPRPQAMPPRRGGMPMMMPAGASPGILYFREASQKLAEARRDGYLDNDQYASGLEKLMGDMRQILIAEARAASRDRRPPPREHEDNDQKRSEHDR